MNNNNEGYKRTFVPKTIGESLNKINKNIYLKHLLNFSSKQAFLWHRASWHNRAQNNYPWSRVDGSFLK